MLSLHPAFQGLIGVSAFVVVAFGIWIVFARWGSRRGSSTLPGVNAVGTGLEHGDLRVDSRVRSATQTGAALARRS